MSLFSAQVRKLQLITGVATILLSIPTKAHASGEQLLYFVAGVTGFYQLFVMWGLLQSTRLDGRRFVAGSLYLIILGLVWTYLFLVDPAVARNNLIYGILVWGGPPVLSLALYLGLRKKTVSGK